MQSPVMISKEGQVHRLVILGGGFGGMSTARALSSHLRGELKKDVSVTILNRRNYHLYTPLLYQAATGLVDFEAIAQPIRRKAVEYGYKFVETEIHSIDVKSRKVFTDTGDYDYDFLVIAMGSVSDVGKIPGSEENSIALKTLEEGEEIHNQIISSFEKAATMPRGAKRDSQLTFVVMGGSTGVELAGSINDYIKLVAKEYPEIDPVHDCAVYVIEKGDRLFPDSETKLSEIVGKTLEKKGVKIRLKTKVASLEKDKINLADGTSLDACNIFYDAGTKPNPIVGSLPEELEKSKGRLVVDDYLRIPGYERVYAIGDLAAARVEPNAKSHAPPNAEAAVEMGEYVGKYLALLFNRDSPKDSRKEPEKFHYNEQGIMLSIGIHEGVAKFKRATFTGYMGWLIWRVVHIYLVSTMGGRVHIMVDWITDSFRRRSTSELK